mgnify:CR=1 FL=1
MPRSNLIQNMIESENMLRARASYLHHKAREYVRTHGSSPRKTLRSMYLSAAAQMTRLGDTLLFQSLTIERYRISVTTLGKTHTAMKDARRVCSKVLEEMTVVPPSPPLEEPEIDVSDWPTAPTTPPLARAVPPQECGAETTVRRAMPLSLT